MSEKGTFALFETSGGAKIHRIPLEVFPNFWAYVYVAQKEDIYALIDAGSGTEVSHEHVMSGLQQMGIEPSALTHLFLTHAHIDHFGGLARLRSVTDAKFGVHELDVQTVAYHEARLAWIGRRLASFLADTGLAEETREQILGIYRFTKAIHRSVPVDFTYGDVDMQIGPFEFIHLPGHCPGHVAIRLDDVVFCGDMVVQGVTPHLAPESINPYNGLDHYLDSLARLQQWSKDARLVLNGHNEAITDLPAEIETTKQNILRRMTRAIDALGVPLTIDEICRAVYGDMNGYNQLLVIEKTGAYVEYLYEHGLVEITNPGELEQGGPARYRRSQDADVIMAGVQKDLSMYTDIQVHR